MSKAKTTALLGIMTALGMMLSYVDSQIPFIAAIPGIKLGLANVVSVFLLYSVSAKSTWLSVISRVCLTSLLFSPNAYHAAYGLCGAILSLSVMTLLRHTGRFSVAGVSMAGGVMHNVGQLACAVLLTNTPQLIFYLGVLTLTGTIFGALVGICATLVLQRVGRLTQ